MGSYQWNWLIFFTEVVTGGEHYYQWLLSGLGWTILTTLGAWILALVFGTLVGISRTTPLRKLALVGDSYTEIFRNIPLIVQMFLWFFVIPDIFPEPISIWIKQELPFPEFTTATIALGFFTSARISELVRAGIQSIPKGQTQAGLALGLTYWQVYRHGLLPLAFRIMIPPLTSEFMNTLKNSSVALTIGLLELTAQARQMNEYTFQGFETFTVTTLLYMAVALFINQGMTFLERKVRIPGTIGGH